MLPALLKALRVARVGPGRPRTTPTRCSGDKAYSSRATRATLRARGITAVIAEPADQAGHRKRRGSKGGRPPAFDPVRYKDRNVVERSYQRDQAMARPGHPLRQARHHLPRRAAHPRRRPMAPSIRRHALVDSSHQRLGEPDLVDAICRRRLREKGLTDVERPGVDHGRTADRARASIHLLGAAKGLGWAEVDQLHQPIGVGAGGDRPDQEVRKMAPTIQSLVIAVSDLEVSKALYTAHGRAVLRQVQRQRLRGRPRPGRRRHGHSACRCRGPTRRAASSRPG